MSVGYQLLGACGVMLLMLALAWVFWMGRAGTSTHVYVNPEDPDLTAARIRWYSANARLAEAEEAERAHNPRRFHRLHARPIDRAEGWPELGSGRR